MTLNDEIIEVYFDEINNKVGICGDPYYDHGQSQGGAAWHAVQTSRADREFA